MCAKLRRSRALHRLGAFLSALSLCFALTVPCFAADGSNPDVAAELTWRSYIPPPTSSSLWRQVSVSAPFYGSNTAFATITHTGKTVSSGSYVNGTFSRFELSSADWFSGAIGLYTSFYFVIGDGNIAGSWTDVFSPDVLASHYQFYYLDHLGTEHTAPMSATGFTPAVSGSSVSAGYTFKASFIADQAEPVSALGFYDIDNYERNKFRPSSDLSNPSVSLVFPSCTVVVTSNSGELAALESMADNIAVQNQIMSQYYGQIVQVCNQIYQRLGDLQAAQEECNALFSQVINLLNTTNGKLSAINQAMSAYFEVLINQLKQEGLDTRSAIADAEARLELYLKPMIDYFNELEEQTGESAATLPGHKTDIDGFNNQGFGIDTDGQTGVAALVPILSAFGWIWSVIALFIGVGVIHILVKKGIG